MQPDREFIKDIRVKTELNRALFRKDIGSVFEQLSEWMEANAIDLPDNFDVPRYIGDQLRRHA